MKIHLPTHLAIGLAKRARRERKTVDELLDELLARALDEEAALRLEESK